MEASARSTGPAHSAPPLGIELALLGLCARESSHAYELYQRISTTDALGGVWRLKLSHLYALLAKLEAAGYLTSAMEPRGSHPPRKMLSLTTTGRQAFEAWLTAPVAHGRDFRLEFLAKLALAREAGAEALRALLDGQHRACEEWLTALRDRLVVVPAEQPFERLVLQFRLGQLEATARWLERCARLIVEMPPGATDGMRENG